jgi:hypothetical protein
VAAPAWQLGSGDAWEVLAEPKSDIAHHSDNGDERNPQFLVSNNFD